MTQNHMLGLGQTILSQVQSLVDLITKANLPQPTSFSRATPTTQQIYPTVIQNCRVQLLEALDELRAVVLGPTSYIFNTCILNVSRRRLLTRTTYIRMLISYTAALLDCHFQRLVQLPDRAPCPA